MFNDMRSRVPDDFGMPSLELKCSAQQLKAASITYSQSGSLYRCSCGPLTEDELAAHERAARDHAVIRLVFPASDVALANVSFQRVQAGWVQLEGRVVYEGRAIERRDSHAPTR